jgi:hypothetical protein
MTSLQFEKEYQDQAPIKTKANTGEYSIMGPMSTSK